VLLLRTLDWLPVFLVEATELPDLLFSVNTCGDDEPDLLMLAVSDDVRVLRPDTLELPLLIFDEVALFVPTDDLGFELPRVS